jgi:hypothetical protein
MVKLPLDSPFAFAATYFPPSFHGSREEFVPAVAPPSLLNQCPKTWLALLHVVPA